MAKVKWTAEAASWLEEIFEFIANDNRDAAARVVDEILSRVNSLEHFPKSGQVYKLKSEGEIRVILFGHYRVAYLLRPAEIVEILGIFHGALDIDRYLKG